MLHPDADGFLPASHATIVPVLTPADPAVTSHDMGLAGWTVYGLGVDEVGGDWDLRGRGIGSATLPVIARVQASGLDELGGLIAFRIQVVVVS
jgi:hypothetical protein